MGDNMNNDLKWKMKKWADIYLNRQSIDSFNSKDVLIDS